MNHCDMLLVHCLSMFYLHPTQEEDAAVGPLVLRPSDHWVLSDILRSN